MSVDEVYRLVRFILNKSQMGDLTSSEFNLIAAQSEREYLSFLLGNVEGFQIGRQIPRVELGMNQPLLQKLSPFIGEPSSISVNGSGLAVIPPDFEAAVAMYTSNISKIRFVQQDAIFQWIRSVIDPIATNPCYLIQSNGFKLYPNNIGSVLLSYVRTPNFMRWGFTLDGNGLEVYDPSTSQQPEWYQVDLSQVIARILRKAGVNLKDGDVVNFAQQMQIQGT